MSCAAGRWIACCAPVSPDYDPNTVLPGFQARAIDLGQCSRDLDDLAALLTSNRHLEERRHLAPSFRERPHLSLFLGSYAVDLDAYDRLAHEFDLFGLFAADIVVGDWAAKNYCFVELEDATEDSIFNTVRGRRTTKWSERFEEGYSQIVDWLWLLEAHRDTVPFERKFGQRRINATGLLIIGRDAGVKGGDWHRLEWRRTQISIQSRQIVCRTYDEVVRGLRRKLDWRLRVRAEAGSDGNPGVAPPASPDPPAPGSGGREGTRA
jgi:hypothetical protein